jgi:calcineurin-like phosphoesterase family protein
MKINRKNYKNIWFTSDWHLGHDRSFIWQNRNFTNIQEHDRFIIDTCNKLVDPDDIMFHMGDFAFRNTTTCAEYLDELNCKNIMFIRGNHDHAIEKHLNRTNSKRLWDLLDLQVRDSAINQCITLCHYPMMSWNKSHHGSWNLCGHSHGSNPQSLPNDLNGKRLDVSIDVGMKFNDKFLFTYEDVVDIMKAKLETEHH